MSAYSDFLRRTAGRGYRWYLAIKIAKALYLPLAAVNILLRLCLCAILLPMAHAVECVGELWSAFVIDVRELCRNRWFTGFSREHYESLDQYRKRAND